MEIYIRATGQSVSEAQFRAEHAAVSLPDLLTAALLDGHGAEPVLEAPAPNVTAFQSAVRNGTTVVNGKRVMAWTVQNWPQAQIDAHKATHRAIKWESIKAERSRRENGGVLAGGNWFHTDSDSRIKIMGLVILGANIPADQVWKTMAKDGNGQPIFVPMNRDLANQIFLAVADLDKLTYAKAEQHRIAMEAAADPAVYDMTTGWPAIFGG